MWVSCWFPFKTNKQVPSKKVEPSDSIHFRARRTLRTQYRPHREARFVGGIRHSACWWFPAMPLDLFIAYIQGFMTFSTKSWTLSQGSKDKKHSESWRNLLGGTAGWGFLHDLLYTKSRERSGQRVLRPRVGALQISGGPV